MANYSQIVETLQSRIDSGAMTFEDAQEVLKRYEDTYLTEKPDLENEEVAEESNGEEPAAAEPVQEAAEESENATGDTKEVVKESSEDDYRKDQAFIIYNEYFNIYYCKEASY
jgi:phage protein D